MKVQRILALAAFSLALGAHAWAEDTLESVKKDIAEKWEAVKSFSASIDVQMDMTRGDTKVSATGSGTVECIKKGAAELIRTDMTVSTVAPGTGADAGKSVQNKQLRVFDGTTTFTEMEMGGQKHAVKTTKNQNGNTGGGKALLDQLDKIYTLTLAPDEKVGDRTGHVILGVPKAEAQQKSKSVRFYLDKETGAMLKSVIMDDAGKPQITTTVKDIKVNPQISEDRFKYTAPAGVEIMDADSTKQTGANPHGAAPTATAPAPAAPAPAPAK